MNIDENKIRFYFYIGSVSTLIIVSILLSTIFTRSLNKEFNEKIEQLSSSIEKEKKDFLRNAVDRTIQLVEVERELVRQEYTNTSLTEKQIEAQAKERIGRIIRKLRLNDDGYIWVNHIIDYEGGDNYAVRQIHPNLPETEGMMLSTNTTDTQGNRPYEVELNGIKKNGELFFKYYFKKLNSDKVSHKMSYAKLYKPYDWVIATGVYLDDLDSLIKAETAQMEKTLKQQKTYSFFLVTAIVILSIVILVIFEKQISKLISSYNKSIAISMSELRKEIAERKNTEAELLKSQQLLLQMGRISQVGGWLFDLESEILQWTDEVYKIHEVDSDYTPNVESAINFYSDKSKSIISEAVQRAIEDGKPFDLELEIITAKGNQRMVHALGLADLENHRIYGAFQDITDRKKTEEENKRLTERVMLATSSAELGVWDWNVRDNSIVCDDRMFELYGLKREGNTNHFDAWINALHPEDKEAVDTAIQVALNGQNNLDIEFRVLHPDGTVKYIKGNGLVIMGADGKPERMLGINADITEKRNFQQAQLQSSQLSALGEVAAGVAHEINNPINGVINYAQVLINKNDGNDPANQILEKIIKEGNRISSIVHNLLNFSQKDRGELSLLNIMDLVVEPLNLNAQFFKKDGIHIEVGIPDDLPQIYGNQMQLEQVVLNLLSNARHALNKRFPEPSNEKFIVIDAISSRDQNGGTVQLRIKDSGCGIPKDNMDKIFNPFFTTKEAGVGTGLGMSVSHDILENHGATISIDSQVNKYTLATITFPIKSE